MQNARRPSQRSPFVDRIRCGLVPHGGNRCTEHGIQGPPDLVVEVLSPSNRSYDRRRPGAPRAEVGRDVLVWAVGERRMEIPLESVFRR